MGITTTIEFRDCIACHLPSSLIFNLCLILFNFKQIIFLQQVASVSVLVHNDRVQVFNDFSSQRKHFVPV